MYKETILTGYRLFDFLFYVKPTDKLEITPYN
nr:MAG TPA: hypothetical protein [Caudoviricetes sp.]DAW85478.1 MAG TPA: hypothetical protein [Bacteriophage sp.]